MEERRLALSLLEAAYGDLWLLGGRSFTGPRPVEWTLEGHDTDIEVDSEPTPTIAFDSGATRCRGGAATRRSAYLCAAAGLVFERAPSTAQSTALALGEAIFIDSSAGGPELVPWIQKAPQAPEEPVLERLKDRDGGPRAMFFLFLAQYMGLSPGEAGLLALGLGSSRTPARSLRHFGEPDLMDVLRHSFGNSREGIARFWSSFSEQRYVRGDSFGGFHFEPARAAVEVRASSLPRHVALTPQVAPTGSVALRVDLDEDPGLLAFRIFCEPPVSTVWSILRIGADGQLASRVPITYQEVASEYSQRVGTDGAEALLVVGTNLGGVDLDHPYDPDHAPHERHSCTIAVDALQDGSVERPASDGAPTKEKPQLKGLGP
jgi:hypothetical protein